MKPDKFLLEADKTLLQPTQDEQPSTLPIQAAPPKIIVPETKSLLENNSFNDDYFNNEDDFCLKSSDEDIMEDVTAQSVASTQKYKLQQFPIEEVSREIEKRKQAFLENTKCIKCEFNGTNSRALAVHVMHLHK